MNGIKAPVIVNIATAEQVRRWHGTNSELSSLSCRNRDFPTFIVYLEPARFSASSMANWCGEIMKLCFPIIDLYRNQLDRNTALQAAA